ncbi:MAG: hypothetical protein ABSF47_02705 [Minisyncoccia bacterium]|jgi:hypothetical protein
MADLARFILVLLVIAVLVCFEGTRFLSVGGINPNLIFIFFLGLILAPVFRKRIRFDFFLVLLGFSFLVGSFLFGFWMTTWLTLTALIVLVYFLKDFLTGHPFPDFLFVLVIGTVLFHVLLRFLTGSPLMWGLILEEAVYNFLLGGIFWLLLLFWEKYART